MWLIPGNYARFPCVPTVSTYARATAQSGPNLKLSGEKIVMTRNTASYQYIPEGVLTLMFHFDGLTDDSGCSTSHSRAHHQDTHRHVKTREILLIAAC
jgi:hypothetical protein